MLYIFILLYIYYFIDNYLYVESIVPVLSNPISFSCWFASSLNILLFKKIKEILISLWQDMSENLTITYF